MRTIGKVLVGAAALSMASPAVMGEEVNVECSCRVSPVNTAPRFDYVITRQCRARTMRRPRCSRTRVIRSVAGRAIALDRSSNLALAFVCEIRA
jgi:hypothetical protein